jgi:hypothetical protein
MPKCVQDRFAADSVDLIFDPWLQRLAWPFAQNAKTGLSAALRGRRFLRDSRKRFRKLKSKPLMGSPLANGAPSILDRAPHDIERLVQRRFCFRIRGQGIRDRLNLRPRAGKSIEQRVVQLLRDPRSLRQPLLRAAIYRCPRGSLVQSLTAKHHGGARQRQRRASPFGGPDRPAL